MAKGTRVSKTSRTYPASPVRTARLDTIKSQNRPVAESTATDPNTFNLPQTIDVEFIKSVEGMEGALTKSERAVIRSFPNNRQGKRAARRAVMNARQAARDEQLGKVRRASQS